MGTLVELQQTVAGILLLTLFLLAPGYLAVISLNLFNARQRSIAEQALWALALSLPLSLLLSELLRRVTNLAETTACLLLLSAVALVVAGGSCSRPRAAAPKGTALAGWCAFFLLIYVVLATLDVCVGHRLFAPTVITDWSVRVPMVVAASHKGFPPLNPLSAIGGNPAALRYYYFWYVLCAQVVGSFHLRPETVLAASAGWAALNLLATALLSVRYLAGVRDFSTRGVGLILLPFAVIVLDALHAGG